MELPTINAPTYYIKLPSSGQKIRIRPFLVKEEKILLIAAESKDTNEIINATKQVISNCILDNDVNINDLVFFDVDYLFIALRAKSVGETIEMNFVCNNVVDDNKCGNIFPVALDISNAEIIQNLEVKDKIDLDNGIGAKMKYPKYSVMKQIVDDENQMDKKHRMIYSSIDYIYNKDKIFSSKEFSREDFDKFIEGLTKTQFEKLEGWVDNFPTFAITAEKDCSKCGHHHSIKYDEFTSFFL